VSSVQAQTATASGWAAANSLVRYALQAFVFYNLVTGADERVELGARRDVASQAYLQSPASMWSPFPLAVPLAVSDGAPVYAAGFAGGPIDYKLAQYLASYPNGPQA
jgi:hypothetical protein